MPTYDAFLSYSHAEDRGVARHLQVGVEKFAKPWYRMRAQRVFLDSNSLSADPGLWTAVERALADASWFVLVTSPDAACSQWVDREIRWWLENRSPGRLLVVLGEGTLHWDTGKGDFDPDTSTALPPALLGALDEEPRWVRVPPSSGNEELTDVDLQETVVDIATAIRGLKKEELVSAAARERRRTMRWVRGVIAGLTILLVAAVVAGAIAFDQRSTAVDQARLALSRQVASVSQQVASSDLDVAMLLAVQAYRRDPNPQTRAALFSADTSSPHLVRFLDAGGKVERLVGSESGAVAAGLADGHVLLWSQGDGTPRQLFQLSRRVSSLAISRDGSVIVAADRARALLWRRDRPLTRLPVPLGKHADLVALSPSGETVAYHATSPGYEEGESITVAATADLSHRVVHRPAEEGVGFGGSLVLPSEDRLLIFGGGSWEWRRVSDWARLAGSNAAFGAHQYGEAISEDGRFFTATNGARVVPVWPTAGATDVGQSKMAIEVPVTDLTALALSPDGSKIAVAGSEDIYVAPVPAATGPEEPYELSEPLDPTAQPVDLNGQASVGPGLLAFAGDENRLLSASGSEIALWDLKQVDRLARETTVPLSPACSACGTPSLAVSPDGTQLAATDGNGAAGFVQSLEGLEERDVVPESELFEYTYGPPVWAASGRFVAFPVWPSAGASEAPVPTELPSTVRAWRGGEGGAVGVTDALVGDGNTVAIVDRQGNVYWQDAETGEQLERSPGPRALAFGEELEDAAIDPSPELVAIVDQGRVTVEDLPSRQVIGRINAGQFATVAFASEHLLVQRHDGSLQVWSQNGATLQRTIPGDESYAWKPVTNPGGTVVVRRRSDGTMVLYDLETGTRLGSFETRGGSAFLRTGIAFSPDGATLYALSEAPDEINMGEFVRRDISDASLVKIACASAGRDLTTTEWRSFVGGDPPGDLSCN